MELKQLMYFKEIADAGSICEAARRLSISQPPLSYQMKLLEDELGARLFDRGARHITLTDAGRLLYDRADNMLGMAAATSKEIENISVHPVLRIGMTPTSEPIMTSLVKRFYITHQDIRYEVHEGSTFQLIEQLDRRVIDITAVRTPVNLVHMDSMRLRRDNMTAAGLPGAFAAGEPGGTISLEELISLPLVIYRRYSGLIRSVIDKTGLKADIICECDDVRTAIHWASCGMGIAVFPASVVSDGLDIRVIACDDLITDILLAWRDDRTLPAAAADFLKNVKKAGPR